MIRALAEWMMPEWFLPRRIILKEMAEGKEGLLYHEMHILKRLRPLQGRCVPRCFGSGTSDGTPALMLEYIEGQSLDQLPPEQLLNPHLPSAQEVSTEGLLHPYLLLSLREMYNLLTQHGVVHGDPELHNFILTETGVKAVDFGLSTLLPNDVTNEHELRTVVDRLVLVIKGQGFID